MKKTTLLIFWLWCAAPSMAQSARIRYIETLCLDGDTLKTILTESTLHVDAALSVYQPGRSRKVYSADSAWKVVQVADDKRNIVYMDRTARKMISRQFALLETLVVQDTLAAIPWKINSRKRQIGKLWCQQAEAHVRGRSYTAWFATAIPLDAGPWKLHGLPGLIVEATSADGRVKFAAESIEIPNTSETMLLLPPVPGRRQGQPLTTAAFSVRLKKNMGNFVKMTDSTPEAVQAQSTTQVALQTIEIYP